MYSVSSAHDYVKIQSDLLEFATYCVRLRPSVLVPGTTESSGTLYSIRTGLRFFVVFYTQILGIYAIFLGNFATRFAQPIFPVISFIKADAFLVIPSEVTLSVVTLNHWWAIIIPWTITRAPLFVCTIDIGKKDWKIKQ